MLRAWARDDDIWRRRSAILSQLKRKEDTDPALLYDCLASSLGHEAFFVQKAIGWALRAFAHTDPGAVRRYVAGNESRLSKLARREALKNIGTGNIGKRMKGFDPKFESLPDYILGVTEEIWEGRGVAALHRYYAPDIPVRSPASVVIGNRSVIAATLATLAEFPDRVLLGEDVIWSGDEEAGFLSSHRILSAATHTGDGAYGPATGRTLRYRVIADCAAKENVIHDEWIVRDQGAIVRQLDLEPKRYAADRIAAEGGPDACVKPLTPDTDAEVRYRGRGNHHPRGAAYAPNSSPASWTPTSRSCANTTTVRFRPRPRGESPDTAGRRPRASGWPFVRPSLPPSSASITSSGARTPRCRPARPFAGASSGKHDGFGAFGEPTGAEVYVLGLSHAELGPRGLRREWVVYDETAIWKQILMHTG